LNVIVIQLHFIKLVYIGWFGPGSGLIGDNLLKSIGVGDNIGSLEWHYNNTLNKLTKTDKPNTMQYYVYDYQGKRVRAITESSHQVQSQRDYLPVWALPPNSKVLDCRWLLSW
jgi:hypothetical protein